ncbi:hypothetical protein [Streptomyces sp. B93]|uniref:hypothetical protein n=1 Tax=Streptomyces sp. B93 TaxID=2824875 RepID=UPI001B37B6B3|nr:hypothetical protein [Streptomyces sp. B93]MBQ1092283.1 hypothetical protein [Streptomyces sp. B93]
MTHRTKAPAIALLAVCAGLVTSCAAPGGAPDRGTRAEPVAEAGSAVDRSKWPKADPNGLAKGLELPLERYMQTYEETVTLDDAERRLQSECMAEYGLEVAFPPAGMNPPPNDNDANMERRYGITDRAAAEKYGYGLPEDLQRQQRTELPALTQPQVEVLSGRTSLNPADTGAAPARASFNGKKIHKDGCAGWADDTLGTRNLDFTLVSELDGQSLVKSRETPEVRAVLADWSACMKDKGHTVDVPYNAIDLAPRAGDTPSAEEIAVAVADIDCKESTNLVRTWFTEDARIQREQIAEHREELTALRRGHTGALTAAEAALGG